MQPTRQTRFSAARSEPFPTSGSFTQVATLSSKGEAGANVIKVPGPISVEAKRCHKKRPRKIGEVCGRNIVGGRPRGRAARLTGRGAKSSKADSWGRDPTTFI